MHPKYLSIKDFTYDLPDDRIAKFPLPNRDESKLLVYKNGEISTTTYQHIAQHLPADSFLIFNDTKVVEARLLFQKVSGGVIEIFCLEPGDEYADITSAMLQKKKVLWKCLVGGASKWKHGMVLEKKIEIEDSSIVLNARIAERLTDSFVIELSWTPASLAFAEVLHHAGVIPLPPYLHRDAEESDKERYQTIYANHDGSVAAPTAGLHFTDKVFEELEKKNITKDFVTLHVGAGTFKPVKREVLAEHEMHAEFIDVSITTIKNVIEHLDKNIIAVGTTSLRTLESLYWMGVKCKMQNAKGKNGEQVDGPFLSVAQWDPYEIEISDTPSKDALQGLLEWMEENKLERLFTKTQILIAPGYKLRIAKGIVTNFHQPQSTLLLLIAAIVGDDWRNIYKYAMDNDFRFLSYGDGCLLMPPAPEGE